jgi:lipopolysaccharide cholinephosphotransferase
MLKKKWILQQLFKPNLPADFFKSKTNSVSRKEKFLALRGLFNSHGISTFIVLGTCLGFVREQNFIEYDHDMDFAFYEEDVEKLKSLVPEMKALGFYIEEVCPCNLRLQAIDCINTCDLWIIHKVKNPFYRLIGHKWLYNNGLFRTDYFNKLTKTTIPVFGEDIRVPNHYEDYLVEHYGTTWRTPQKGMNAIYRGFVSQVLNKLFFDSPMPSKFSGVDQTLIFKKWVSFILRTFFPKAAITNKHKHPS